MKVGFIGCGNMATAMIRGIINGKQVQCSDLIASDKAPYSKQHISEELNINYGNTNAEVAQFADIIFLAVKPQYYADVINDISEYITNEKVIVTIAPGETLKWLENKFGHSVKIIRTMPNTPAMVQEGMMGVCKNELVTEEELDSVRKLCSSFAKTECVKEELMDVVTSVSGSSPAYVFMFIEAMADAAVAAGMPRNQAYRFAAQAVLGSAKMVLETGKHPGELKDMVCSPGGTTMQAVQILEERCFRGAVMEAMDACIAKSREMQ